MQTLVTTVIMVAGGLVTVPSPALALLVLSSIWYLARLWRVPAVTTFGFNFPLPCDAVTLSRCHAVTRPVPHSAPAQDLGGNTPAFISHILRLVMAVMAQHASTSLLQPSDTFLN